MALKEQFPAPDQLDPGQRSAALDPGAPQGVAAQLTTVASGLALEPGMRRGAAVAGFGLLMMTVLAMAGTLVANGPAGSQAAVPGSEGLVGRIGVLCLYGVALLDVVVAWGLTEAFRPTDRGLAVLAGWLRLVYAAVFIVAITQLAGGQPVEYHRIWQVGLLVFGAHLLLVGRLVARSGWLPRWLGVLVSVAGAGYGIDSVLAILLVATPFSLSAVTFIGELLLAGWLVAVASRRLSSRLPDAGMAT